MKIKLIAVVLTMLLVAGIASADKLRVGVVLSSGGLGDESFNDATYAGVYKLRESGEYSVEVVDPGTITAIEPGLIYFAERKLDLICALGIFANEPVRKVAAKYPDQKFVVIDSVVTLPNVLSILFDEEQGSFYAGAFAALASKNNVIGFLGGMESPVIASFERGFFNGARFVKPDIKFVSKYIGTDPAAFSMPDKAEELSMALADEGADVIYHAAGKSGLGLINASRRGNFLVIGVDTDQSRVSPGRVPASMVKRIDNALIRVAGIAKKGEFTSGIWTMSLLDDGIELAVSRFNRGMFTAEEIMKLKDVRDFLLHNSK